MTIFATNSIFKPVTKFIKFIGNKISVINGSNTMSSLPLCNVKIDYKQYQRLSIQIPAGQIDYVLSFSMLGIKPTFLAINPIYSSLSSTNNTNYLNWKYQSSIDPKKTFTNLLILTATTSNPITNIIIDNPNTECDVQLEILVAAMDNDYLNDVSPTIYLNNLEFTNIKTQDEINSGILEYYDENNELNGSTDLLNIVDVYKVPYLNRIIITDSDANVIILDFVSEYHVLQALSAINWVLNDINNRALPKVADIVPPVITYTNAVIGNDMLIDLVNYLGSVFTKQNFIDDAILNIIDAIDGNITPTITNIKFNDGIVDVPSIVNEGIYNVLITISDFAGNETTETIIVDAQLNVVDLTPPVITFTDDVVLNVASITLATYFNNFTYNDAKVLCLLSVIDNIDGPISLSNVTVEFIDSLLAPVLTITVPDTYTVNFIVQDTEGNETTETISIIAV